MSKWQQMTLNKKILFLLVVLGYGGGMFASGFLVAILTNAFEYLFTNYIDLPKLLGIT